MDKQQQKQQAKKLFDFISDSISKHLEILETERRYIDKSELLFGWKYFKKDCVLFTKKHIEFLTQWRNEILEKYPEFDCNKRKILIS